MYILHNHHAPTLTFKHLNSPPGLQKSYIWSRILSAGPMRQRNYWILGQNVNKEYLSKQFQLKKDLQLDMVVEVGFSEVDLYI